MTDQPIEVLVGDEVDVAYPELKDVPPTPLPDLSAFRLPEDHASSAFETGSDDGGLSKDEFGKAFARNVLSQIADRGHRGIDRKFEVDNTGVMLNLSPRPKEPEYIGFAVWVTAFKDDPKRRRSTMLRLFVSMERLRKEGAVYVAAVVRTTMEGLDKFVAFDPDFDKLQFKASLDGEKHNIEYVTDDGDEDGDVILIRN